MKSSILMKFGKKHENDFSFSRQYGESDFYCPAHWHDCFEILSVRRGEFLVSVNGADLLLKEGDVAVVPPGVSHSTRSVLGEYDVYVFGYIKELIYTPDISILNLKYLDPLSRGCERAGYVIPSGADKDSRLYTLLSEVHREYEADSYGKELKIRSLILLIHSVICDYFIGAGASDGRADTYIVGAEKYIEANVSEDISPLDIAAALHISYSHLARILHSSLGISAVELIARMKMNYAEELMMADPDMSITDVGASVGFNSASYFTRQFKRIRGMTPGEFRKYLRNA